MSAVLVRHRCPKCAAEVVVYARAATVYHACAKASLREKMTTFRVVTPDESQRKSPRTLAGRDNGTAR